MYNSVFILTMILFRAQSYQFGAQIGDASNNINEEVQIPKVQLIFPGTKWCGAGNIADNTDDLGEFQDVDKCCRNHDLCPQIIPAYQSDYNLTNPTFYTRLSCDCDNEFHNCLKEAGNIVSSQIGFLYFTIIGTQCFRKDYPIINCSMMSYIPRIKCNSYELDTTKDKVYQFFDVPNY